jgi:hypothetical protein
MQTNSVDPQQSTTFTFQVTAPHAAGEYDFAWRMVREGVTWFGVQTPTVPIAVGADTGVCGPLH